MALKMRLIAEGLMPNPRPYSICHALPMRTDLWKKQVQANCFIFDDFAKSNEIINLATEF